MAIYELLSLLENKQLRFKDVLNYISQHYTYTPSSFINGDLHNTAEENQGSAKVLYFAFLHSLTEKQTLQLFAEHLDNVSTCPEGTNHPNIRQFIKTGWQAVLFENVVLRPK